MYNKVRNYWYKEVVASLMFFENQEKSRIEKTIALMKDYIKIASNPPNIANQVKVQIIEKYIINKTQLCKFQTNKALMEFLNNFSVEKEMDFWIKQNSTGQNRPIDIEIQNYDKKNQEMKKKHLINLIAKFLFEILQFFKCINLM